MSIHLLAFYAACTALVLFVLGSLAVPLLRRGGGRSAPDRLSAEVTVYRDQVRELESEASAGTLTKEELAAERREIDARLGSELVSRATMDRAESAASRFLRSKKIAIATAGATAIVIVASAWGLYAWRGNPLAIEREAPASVGPIAGKPAATAPLPSMDVLAQRLALKLRTQTPEDGEGWALLARSYVELKQYREAADAFAKATKLVPADATLLADYADALGMADGKTLRGEPATLVQRALKADPRHPKALSLAASVAFEEKKYREAMSYWQRLAAILPKDSEEARRVEVNIAEARALMEGKALAAPIAGDTKAEADSGTSISGSVRIAPDLAAKVARGDTLYVYARAMTGPAMPLAIVRARAGTFPYVFRLDDSQAMLPELSLSRVAEVALTARVSHGGAATPQSGDLQGTVPGVRVGARGVDLVIDQIVR